MKQPIVLIIIFCFSNSFAQKYKVFSEAGSYGIGSRAIYEKDPQKKVTEFIYSSAEIVLDKYFIVTEQGQSTAQLLDVNLKVIIPSGKYSKISVSEENLNYARVCANGKYGIFDITIKKIVVPCNYAYLGDLNKNGITPYNRNGVDMMPQLVQGGKWGYVNTAGVELMPPTYTWCSNLNGTDFGTAYVGGNSNDGLYGGYWTLINSKGKILIDDSKYHVKDKDPYNEAPWKHVMLYKKNDANENSILVSCDGKTLKEYKYNIGIMYSDGLMEVSQKQGNDYESPTYSGLIDMNENVIVPLKYSSIRKSANIFFMTLPGGGVEYLDNNTKVIKPLGIKDYNELNYNEKEKKTEDLKAGPEKESLWLIYGKDENNKWQFFDTHFKKVLSDVDSTERNNAWVSAGFEKNFGTIFKYYKNGYVNFFMSSNKNIISKNFNNVQDEFEDVCLSEKYKTDSVFVLLNGKWGVVSTNTFEGSNFVYDKIEVLNENLTIAKKSNKFYIFGGGKRAYGFPPFDKVLQTKNSSYRIPRKDSHYYPHAHFLVEKNGKKYLIDISGNLSWDNSFSKNVLDSGKIDRLESDLYFKNGLPYLLWTQKILPKGTTRCYNLSDWTSKSDINIYAYKVGEVYGVMDENGKIIEKPHYPETSHVSIWPPDGFDYKEKRK